LAKELSQNVKGEDQYTKITKWHEQCH